MLNEMEAWISSIIAPFGAFTMAVGEWVEPTGAAEAMYCALTQEGGRAVDVEDRRPHYRVVILGRRNKRGDSKTLAAAAEALVAASIDGSFIPCGAASIRAMGEPVGPGFTAEQRAWFSIDFQITL